jgi:hypothetical protein
MGMNEMTHLASTCGGTSAYGGIHFFISPFLKGQIEVDFENVYQILPNPPLAKEGI